MPGMVAFKQQQAIVFTKNLIKILEEEKGWKFPHKQIALSKLISINFKNL